jgi:DNA-binding NarL/FixJ family response regulator
LNLRRPISVVLADDHAMVRESLARVLDACGEIAVVGQAGDGIELIEVVRQTRPECLVMDYSMPDHDPTEVIKQLLDEFRSLRILVLTVHENVHYAVRTLQAGAHGYLIKSAAVEEFVDAIRSIRDGNVYISRKIAAAVWMQLRRPRGKRGGLESLSQREFDVLRIIGGGASLQECAQQLNVSVSTVSTYRGRILEKLDLATTSDLVRFAIENKMLG